MQPWMFYAVGAAVLYGAHQIFTRLASERISDGLGGLIVEASAVLTILVYLAGLYFSGRWNQTATRAGVWYSILTGHVRVSRDAFLLSPVSKRRAAFLRSGDSRWGLGGHGGGWHRVVR